MLPAAPYNAKPAPIHLGDWDARGFSTVFMTSAGYDSLVGQSTPTPSAVQLDAPRPAINWVQTSGAGVLLLVALAFYLDGRVR